jgi:hypothetical protein
MFEYTTQGYKEAIKFLIETNNYPLLDKEPSVDGYTIVTLANSINYSMQYHLYNHSQSL